MDLLKQKLWFDSPEFQKEFHCEEPLGVFLTPAGTTFRLWAPTAQDVTLHLYAEGNHVLAFESISMIR